MKNFMRRGLEWLAWFLGLAAVMLTIFGLSSCGGRGSDPKSTLQATGDAASDQSDPQLTDDLLEVGQFPTDYVRGSYSIADLDLALTRQSAEANDILWLLYWVDRADQAELLQTLQAHGYGTDDAPTLRSSSYATAGDGGDDKKKDPPAHTERDSSLHQQYFSSQWGGDHAADVSRNHDLGISRTWDHDLQKSRATHEWEISKKFGFGHKLEVSSEYQYHEKDTSIVHHDTSISASWPSNHFAEVSHDHPPGIDHKAADSRIWPPNHVYFRSSQWPDTDHTASVSRGYPPNHSVYMTKHDETGHDWRLSVQYPQPHASEVSRSHAIAISRSWPTFPTGHSTAASRTRPPNHFEAVSDSWPPKHIAGTSRNWPSNHFAAVSQQWDQNDPGLHSSWWSKVVPPGHTWYDSTKGTVEIGKDIKEILKKTPEESK
jgi:hypothetical protein